MIRQIYCTAKEVMDDLSLKGFEDRVDLMDRIRAASEVIQRKAWYFIPVEDTFTFGARVRHEYDPLSIKPLLSITSITNDGETVAVADYTLKPLNRMWVNGPYIFIEQSAGWSNQNEVVIAGNWGLYEESVSLGVNTTQATSTETTLAVTNGSVLSPGMLLLIESEQELITAGGGGPDSPAGTAATSLVNGAIDENDASITVDNGAEFNVGEILQIDVEDMKILKINTHVLAVERGWNGTAPADHLTDSAINVYRTFKVERAVNGTTAAIHTNKAVSQYVVPETVNYLCRQIAALMRMKAASGFTGITGNAEQGQGRYLSEFPPRTIEDILAPFRVGE